MENFRRWERLGYALFTVAVIAALIAIGRTYELKTQDWAAWVQAIGSIGAILVAIWVSHRQHEKERELEVEKKRLDDIRRLKAVKAILVQICTVSHAVYNEIAAGERDKLYDFDPHFFTDYTAVLRALPLFEIPSAELALYVTMLPRSIDEVTVRLFEAREQEDNEVFRYEWLLAHDIEERVKNLHNLAVQANNRCVDEINSLGGYTPDELAATNHS